MCVSPGLLSTGELIPCRKCWQCKETKIDDWVGRCIAESKTAKATNFVTLTYGMDDNYEGVDAPRSAVLTYSDVQKFFKRLRKAGYPMRYFCVGEYGSLKGRSHWHIIVFWLRKVPKFNLDVREHSPFWIYDGKAETKVPIGWVKWETCSHPAIRYCCKYIVKALDDTSAQAMLRMSKKPPLGAEYFRLRAIQHVEQGLSPQDLFYSWPEVKNLEGKVIRFRLHAKSADLFIEHFVNYWRMIKHNDMWPTSQLVEDWLDKKTRDEIAIEYDEDEERERLMDKPFKQKVAFPYLPSPGGGEPQWSEQFNSYVVWDGGERWFWSYGNEGERSWQKVIVSEKSAERRVESAIVREMFEQQRRDKTDR